MEQHPRASASRLPDRQRQDPRREHRRRQGLQRRRHPPAGQPDLRRGLAGGADRQPRARRLRHQAGGDGPALPEALRPGAGVRRLSQSMKKAVDDEDLDVTADHVLVLRNAGPQGGPGMPEWGMLPMPKKLLKQGHRDMLRMSDARMSGTSYGACILHVSPESYIGGPLALLRTGDIVSIDVDARTHQHGRLRGRTRQTPRRLDPAGDAVRARLRLGVHQAHPAGQRRLRLRLPAHRFRRAGVRTRHLLRALRQRHDV